jgi:predicted nucleic acid-binding protein
MKAIGSSAFVLDASIALKWAFIDEVTEQSTTALKLLSDNHAEVPAVWPFEVWNIVTRAERRGRLTAAQSKEFLETLCRLDIRVERRTLFEIAALADIVRKHSLTIYDAAYLELAMRKGLPLATADVALAKAAKLECVTTSLTLPLP